MFNLIVNRDESFWPQKDNAMQPHPIIARLAEQLLIAALYNYDQIHAGRSEDFVSYLDMSEFDRERYRARIQARG